MPHYDFTTLEPQPEKKKYPLVPVGRYDVVCIKATRIDKGKTFDGHKKHLFKLTFQIITGDYEKSFLYENFCMYPDVKMCMQKLAQGLKGLSMESFFNDLEFDAPDFEGRTANVCVEHEIYNGEPKAKIEQFSYKKIDEKEEIQRENPKNMIPPKSVTTAMSDPDMGEPPF